MASRALGNPWAGFILALVVIVLDQYTKMWASNELVYRVPVEITSWFDLMLTQHGAAFSFLASAGGWQRWFLAAVAMLVSVFVAVWLTRLEQQQRILAYR